MNAALGCLLSAGRNLSRHMVNVCPCLLPLFIYLDVSLCVEQALELRSIKELLQNSSVIDAANAKAKTKDSEQVLLEANATIQNSEHHLQGIRRADMPLHVTSTFPSFDGIVHSTVVDAAEAKAMTQDQLSIGDRESPEISVETGTESKTRARSGKLTAFRNDIYLQYESYASFKPALH